MQAAIASALSSAAKRAVMPERGSTWASKRMGGAVKLRRGDDIAAAIGDIGEGIMQRRLARGGGQRRDAAFQIRDALFQHRHGGIGDAAVAIAFFFQIEQGGAVIGAVEGIGRRLVDRHRHRMGRGIGVESGMNGDGFGAHERLCSRSAQF